MKAAIEQMVKEMNEFSNHVYFNISVPDFYKRYEQDHAQRLVDGNISRYVYGVEFGKKNARIFRADYANQSTRSVVWFVNMETGDILKANGWKAASKYVRGHVSNWQDAMSRGSKLGIYGFISCKEGR
ncbi:hypothetical protein Ah1_00055 [Aeromonas phage Ah1]|uniref:Uncharacterized protein n=1 Tax=Aeromonas phage Ah1 TaxID=2053701 RepID=A0A2H4YF81_9CAUD|nr:hypothetical protein KNT77_gp055 [Aeromonas phage Ah1]AUE22596.1 hypothetical protein Ah1_00055 [Aeromonas phage Ah1]